MTDFLFARPSVLEGIGRNVDLFGIMTEYNTSESSEEADLLAIENDMAMLQADMDIACEKVLDEDLR